MKTKILFTVFAGALTAVMPLMAAEDVPAARANGFTVEPVPASTNGSRASHPTVGPAAAAAATNDSAPAHPDATAQPTPALPDGTPLPADQPPPAATSATNSYGSVITMANGQKGIVMNFRGVSLETVLNFMSDAAGLAINPDNRVDVSGKVNLWSVKPVSKEEAMKMLIQM